jgi:hypothetical protein
MAIVVDCILQAHSSSVFQGVVAAKSGYPKGAQPCSYSIHFDPPLLPCQASEGVSSIVSRDITARIPTSIAARGDVVQAITARFGYTSLV